MVETKLPSVHEIAFNCPQCGVLAHQWWHDVYSQRKGNNGLPKFWQQDEIVKILEGMDDEEDHKKFLKEIDRIESGEIFLTRDRQHVSNLLVNLYLSECYSCRKISVWRYDKLIFPQYRMGPLPNQDLPEDVVADFEEARTILELSPRGAAALLRLSIQKLCGHLGGNGKNINEDIGKLVSDGLDIRVQQALDIVRVTGNEAVHPGLIDLRDDRDTATKLFGLVNLIAERMISQPKHIQEMYNNLPQSKLDQIVLRDEKKP